MATASIATTALDRAGEGFVLFANGMHGIPMRRDFELMNAQYLGVGLSTSQHVWLVLQDQANPRALLAVGRSDAGAEVRLYDIGPPPPRDRSDPEARS